MALSEFRRWRKSNPNTFSIECIQWTIESVGEIKFEKYDSRILNKELVANQISANDNNDQQFIFTLDISVITAGFGQLIDEGIIDQNSKPLIQLAIDRQRVWTELNEKWNYKEE